MTTPTPVAVHHWLDAIQRGQMTTVPEPQLAPEAVRPSAEERQWLRQLHAEMTGETLDLRWLDQVLQPRSDGAALAVTPATHPTLDDTPLSTGGWRRWWAQFRHYQERPRHTYASPAEARRAFLAWRRRARWSGLMTGVTLGGGVAWLLGRLAPEVERMQVFWNAGVKAAGSVAAFQAQAGGHQMAAMMTAWSHEATWCLLVLGVGALSLTTTLFLDFRKVQHKPVLTSVERRVAWSLSPRAQRYLQQRKPGQPFLMMDHQRLNRLAESDGVGRQRVAAPLADRDPEAE
jgi:hypothetical protein